MKKKKLNHLQLNKKSISSFNTEQVKGKGPGFPLPNITMIFYFNAQGQCLCLSAEVC